MKRRENTFRIDYAKVPKKPSYEELHEFVGSVLGMKREEVKRIQCSRHLGCAFVKTSSLEVAQRVVEEHDGKHELKVDNNVYPLRIWMEDGGTDVKLFDLSEDVEDEAIAEFMQAFGDVLSIRELTWDSKYRFGGISTGVRVVRMVVKRNIPSSVNIDGEVTCVAYNGQNQTCRHCNEYVHSGISCIQNKKLLMQKLQADHLLYANVAKQPAASKEKTNTTTKSTTHNALPLPARGQPAFRPTSSSALNPKVILDRLSVSSLQQFPQLPPQQEQQQQEQQQQQQQQQQEMPPPPPVFLPSQLNPSFSNQNLVEMLPIQPTTSGENPQHTDGQETDDSIASNSSSNRRLRSRQPYKKFRQEKGKN